MKRDYNTGEANDIIFFTGVEVEKTPAFGMKTLFVTGVQPCDVIQKHYDQEQCGHIFFGANHSFNPGTNFPEDADQWTPWENMIKAFLTAGKICSLDIPITLAEAFLESGLIEYDNLYVTDEVRRMKTMKLYLKDEMHRINAYLVQKGLE